MGTPADRDGGAVSERRVLITGAAGYVGALLGRRLVAEGVSVLGTDVRAGTDLPFEVLALDIRSQRLKPLMRERGITHVVHLASVLESRGDRVAEYDIAVNGTKNVVEAALAARVRHLTVSSSGAAYGYHADNPRWITESHPLRAAPGFAYAYHKRLVEEMLATYRTTRPALGQLVFRISTVLGAATRNQITALFERERILVVRGSDSPFVFIWDEDVVAAMLFGVIENRTGVFNLAGDGALTIHQIAARLGKPTRELPAWLLKAALWAGRRLRVTRYGPEQLDFLRFRPVLANLRLKEELGFTPEKTSAEAFEVWARAHGG